MKQKIKLIFGMIWASPVTLLAFLCYILPLWILGKYSFVGWDEIAWIWKFDPRHGTGRLSRFLRDRWRHWSGSAFGNLIVVKHDPRQVEDSRSRIMIHEKEHVKQFMVLGIFHLPIYVLIYLVSRFILKNVDGYYDNVFEIDARRKAGQLIDVVGTIQKLKAEAKKQEEIN